MPNERGVLCPFYIRSSKYRVACEGLGPRETLIHEFPDREGAKEWKEDFCCEFTFRGCPWYQLLMEVKYSADSEAD